eukprot:scaffold123954_cov17-Tisochrysis_lutea.AAC.1
MAKQVGLDGWNKEATPLHTEQRYELCSCVIQSDYWLGSDLFSWQSMEVGSFASVVEMSKMCSPRRDAREANGNNFLDLAEDVCAGAKETLSREVGKFGDRLLLACVIKHTPRE